MLPGLQEAAAEKFDRIFEVDANENSDPNVSKMLANDDGVECRPYRSRTCDTLIKSLLDGVLFSPLTFSLVFFCLRQKSQLYV